MKHGNTKLWSILLSLALVLGLMPGMNLTASAASPTYTLKTEEYIDEEQWVQTHPEDAEELQNLEDKNHIIKNISLPYTFKLRDIGRALNSAMSINGAVTSDNSAVTIGDMIGEIGAANNDCYITIVSAASDMITISFPIKITSNNVTANRNLRFKIIADPIAAPSYTITLEPKNTSGTAITEVTQGDTFNLGVKVGGGAFAGATVTIGYDAAAFTAGDVTWATGTDTTNSTVDTTTSGKIGLIQLTTTNQADGITIATIPFTTGASAEAKQYSFTVDSSAVSQTAESDAVSATANPVNIMVKIKPTVAVYSDYVSGWTLVTASASSGSSSVLTYDGGNMYYLERESAYAILVQGTVTQETAAGKVSVGTQSLGTIPTNNYDVNGTNKTDYSDVLMTYRVSQIAYSTPSDAMEIYLRADVNGSHKVDMTDVKTVISNAS